MRSYVTFENYKNKHMKKLLIVLFVFCNISLFGQARLIFSTGNSSVIPFYFNSYQKYVNGISYNDYTRLSIEYRDTTAANTYPHWRLDCKALTPTINGDAGNTLALNYIELQATGAGTSTNIQFLNSTDVTLLNQAAETAPGSPATVFVSYYCGVTNSLLGKNIDYYTVDILFTLTGEN